MKFASIGSVSTGTMRDDDLLETFYGEIEYQISRQTRNGDCNDILEHADSVLADAEELYLDNGDIDQSKLDSGEVAEWINEKAIDCLEQFAPPYSYFGSHPGDGADYGYWPSSEAIDELPKFDSADSALEAGQDDDFAVVNDHGNVTIYRIKRVAEFVVEYV